MTVAIVVPLFSPSDEVVDRLRSLAVNFTVVAVDDSPAATEEPLVDELRSAGVVVLRHSHNRGIAAALNTGIKHVASIDGSTAVLTLDQDSCADRVYIDAAAALLEANPSVGLVYPQTLNHEPQVRDWSSRTWRALEPMQSGWLMRIAACADVGPFREEFFIDCVDTDYYLRTLDRGWTVHPVMGGNIEHELGAPRSVLGIAYREHPPFRLYYMVRNRLLTARLHGRRHRVWAARSLARTCGDVMKALVFGGQRTRAFVMMARAVKDAAHWEHDAHPVARGAAVSRPDKEKS